MSYISMLYALETNLGSWIREGKSKSKGIILVTHFSPALAVHRLEVKTCVSSQLKHILG